MAATKPAETRQCACWCGQSVAPKSTFRQGHDQKLVGLVAYMVVDGGFTNEWVEYLQLPTEIDGQDIQERIDQLTAAVGKMFSEGLARKVDRAAMRAWQDAGKKGLAVVAEQMKATPEAVARETVDVDRAVAIAEDLATKSPMPLEQVEADYAAPALGASIRVKVGRWERDAIVHGMSQAGKVTAIRYTNGDGKEVVRTDGKFKIL